MLLEVKTATTLQKMRERRTLIADEREWSVPDPDEPFRPTTTKARTNESGAHAHTKPDELRRVAAENLLQQ